MLCALLLLGGVLAFELVVGRTELVAGLYADSETGTLHVLEQRIIQPLARVPQIAVLGTSRARGAFLPTIMEEELGLVRGDVQNLAMGGANIYDALLLYQRNRAKLAGTRDLVIQIDGFQLNLSQRPNSRYRRYATWEDRMAYTGRYRAQLIADQFLRGEAISGVIPIYFERWIRERKRPEPPAMDRYGRLAFSPIGEFHNPRDFTDAGYGYWIREFYTNFQYSTALEGQLRKLIALAREDGSRVHLVYMPTLPRFQALLEAQPGNPHKQFRARVHQLARELDLPLLYMERPEELGFVERDFSDWGHLNTRAAEKWSRFTARWIAASETSAH